MSTISDNIRGADGSAQDDDFVQVEGTDFGIIDGRVTKEEGLPVSPILQTNHRYSRSMTARSRWPGRPPR